MQVIRIPKSPTRDLNSQNGFTLVEMAVVLVIIGIILGAVMIGRDAQRNAEYTRIRQNFVSQWAVAYNSYVQRYGVPPGDEPRAPRLIVNGAKIAANQLSGNASSLTEPNALCASEGTVATIGRTADTTLRNVMLQAGIQLPQGRGQGMEDRYVYLDTNGNPQQVQVCFQWNKPDTKSGAGNVMVVAGVTPDLARSLSVAIDGNTDASSGSFRQQGVTEGAGQTSVGSDWTATNLGESSGSGDPQDINLEAQVSTVIGHYKMNQ
jgi:prepilin-type N-terminal cleavage/methylation domain-containing protein